MTEFPAKKIQNRINKVYDEHKKKGSYQRTVMLSS